MRDADHRSKYFVCIQISVSQEFAHRSEARIVGRVASSATRLTMDRSESINLYVTRPDAPLVFPSEHKSFAAVLLAESRRFGIIEKTPR
jgi:hypothetical protein